MGEDSGRSAAHGIVHALIITAAVALIVYVAVGCTTYTATEPIVCNPEITPDSVVYHPAPHPKYSEVEAVAACVKAGLAA